MRDSILIYKMKLGNEDAIEEFINKYYSDIYKYCYRRISSIETSEDLTQETFEKFFKNINEYKHFGKAKNYLYVISGNLCRNHYKRKIHYYTERINENIENIEELSISCIEDKITINEAINLLPEELRDVIVLYFFQDLRLKEISQILDIKLSLVKYRITKGKEKLQAILEKEDFNL